MKVLIDGGDGFISRHLAKALRQQGHSVLQIDNTYPQLRTTGDERFCDVREPTRLTEIFSSFMPDCVYHLAAYTSVRESFKYVESYITNNILGTWYVLECALHYGTTRFVNISSGGTVYGEPTILPVPWLHPLIPSDIYGLTKMTAEHLVRIICSKNRMFHWSLRYPNVYGPGQDPDGEAGAVAIFTKKMLRGEPVTINGDGSQTRDWMLVHDVVKASIAVLNYPSGEYNVGTAMETSLWEVFEILKGLTDYTLEPTFGPAKWGEVHRLALRPNILLNSVTPLRQGLALTVESYREELKNAGAD